jgi:hypothetical protein
MLIKFIVSKYESFFYVHLGSIGTICACFYLGLMKIRFLTPMATKYAILKNRHSNTNKKDKNKNKAQSQSLKSKYLQV